MLSDNFASIVNGIEEGRVIFDNLRKSIAYTLTSNIPEIVPYLVFIVFSIPLPLSTVLILCVDLGTDMFPAISFAHESKEADIMLRPPRNSKTDRLVDWGLIRWAYGMSGMIQTGAGFYSYFVVFYQFGMTLPMLYNLDRDAYFGKHSMWCDTKTNVCGYVKDDEEWCNVPGNRLNHSYCYTPTQAKYILAQAQTAFFVAIVFTQFANVIVCKTRKLSIFTKGFQNHLMIFGIIFEFGLCALLCYAPPFQAAFGTEYLAFRHWMLPLAWFMVIVLWDETRKYWVRTRPNSLMAKINYY